MTDGKQKEKCRKCQSETDRLKEQLFKLGLSKDAAVRDANQYKANWQHSQRRLQDKDKAIRALRDEMKTMKEWQKKFLQKAG